MLYPHERSLVEKYRGQPVVLVGVNSDADRATVKKIMDHEGITWRNFWVEGPDAPVHQQFHVRAWPTTFVIDGQGVIRFQPRHPEEIDQAVQTLLREGAGKRPS